eukprot:2233366-Amphidinium_carterae.1
MAVAPALVAHASRAHAPRVRDSKPWRASVTFAITTCLPAPFDAAGTTCQVRSYPRQAMKL